MPSYKDRLRAVKVYIQLGKRTGATFVSWNIRFRSQLGLVRD